MDTHIILPTVILTTLLTTVFIIIINFRYVKKPLKELEFHSIATQLIALTVWVALLGNIFIPLENRVNVNVSLGIFIASIIIGIFLIRSIFKEMQSEKTVEILVDKLQKNNSRLKKLDQQKTEFVSLASHQLRGPVAVIRGYASMMLEDDFGKLTEDQKTPLERILRSSEALGFLISDYLEVTRIEKGEMEYIIEDVNLSELISSIVEEFSSLAEKANLSLSFGCEVAEKPIIIRGDKNKLRQIFSNLVDNAIKYTKEGNIQVQCVSEEDGITISVKDTGIGISPEKIEEIFSKFIRTKEARKMNVTGTGLGLFLARVMTEAQDGKISVKSEGIGKGSEFSVWFPGKE